MKELTKVDEKEELKRKIELRELVIAHQRSLINMLREQLNRKRKWYLFWR